MGNARLIIIIGIFFVITLGMAVGCGSLVANEAEATRALEAQGYTSVKITGKNVFAPALSGCSEKDSVAFKADATNVRGQRITDITICQGVLKKSTVRY